MTKQTAAVGSLAEVTDFCSALANENRQLILMLFASKNEWIVGDIAKKLGLGMSTVSEHLAIMRRAGILEARKLGREVYYRADRERVAELLECLASCVRECCSGEAAS